MANSTAGQIAGYIWNILRTSGSTTDLPALQDSFILTLINNANQKYLRAHRRAGGSEPLAQYADTGFTIAAETSLNGAVTTSSTTMPLNSVTNFDTTNGALCIYDNAMPDIVFYTAISSLTLTGVTKIGFSHASGTAASALYRLPSDFQVFRPSDAYGDGVRLNGVPMRYAEGLPLLGYFSIIDNGTYKYLWLPRGITGTASVNYEKTPTSITSDSDTVDVPPEYEFFLVWEVISTVCVPKGDSSELYAMAKHEAAEELRDSLMNKNISKYARVKPFQRLRRRPFDFTLYISQPR